MKTYYICAGLIFFTSYAVFHFNFRTSGNAQLYRINDRIAFELHEENEHSNGIAVRGYRPTNAFVKFICGACQTDRSSAVDMVNARYRDGDYVFTDFPQHDRAPTDIVNLRTGEAINAQVATDFGIKYDLTKVAEYRERGLVADERYRLKQNFVTANFPQLSTFTDRCIYVHLLFGIVALILAFPKRIFRLIDAMVHATDPNNPMNRYKFD